MQLRDLPLSLSASGTSFGLTQKYPCLLYIQTVRHLIGRSGCVVTQLEKDSGAQLKFQHEAEMDPLAIGRILEILGTPQHQNLALYQILRKVRGHKK